MNLILLHTHDFLDEQTVKLTDHRLEHIQNILKAKEADTLLVGLINGHMGEGVITSLSNDEVLLDVNLHQDPPKALDVTVCLALPRPIMLRRILFTIAQMGVKKLILFHSNRVEKSYWQSTSLKQEAMDKQLILGLEQAKDTVLPEVILKKRFKPFIEDDLPDLIQDKDFIVADPSGEACCPSKGSLPIVLMIGPEGGFIPYELEMLMQKGANVVNLGDRIYRVETAVSILLSKLF